MRGSWISDLIGAYAAGHNPQPNVPITLISAFAARGYALSAHVTYLGLLVPSRGRRWPVASCTPLGNDVKDARSPWTRSVSTIEAVSRGLMASAPQGRPRTPDPLDPGHD